MDALLNPASIAIVGASNDPSTIGGKPLRFLKKFGYQGAIYPVNPKYDEIAGLRCYASIAQLPQTPDLAIVAVSAPLVLDVLEYAAEENVRSAVVFSGGFGEAGPEGARLQAQLEAFVRRSSMRLLGPNCQGFVNLHEGVLGTFSGGAEMPDLRPGPIALVSQSGAFGFSIFAQAQSRGVGIGYVVTTGNESDITATDAAEALLARDDVAALLMYIESVPDGRRFRDVASRALAIGKPIVLLKGGAFHEGQGAARSHTAALAADEAIFDAVCRDYGVCRIGTITAACDLAQLFERQSFSKRTMLDPQPIAIVSTSGGASVLAVDECVRKNLGLAQFGADAGAAIARIVPAYGRSENPIDVTGQIINDPSLVEQVMGAILADKAVGGVLVIVTMVTGDQAMHVATAIARARRVTQKPVVVAWTAPECMIEDAQGLLASDHVPVFDDPVRAVRALAAVRDLIEAHANWLTRTEHKIAASDVRTPPRTEAEFRRLLVEADFPWCREELVHDAVEAESAAGRIGYPVVAKIVSTDIPHKSDAGLVRMPLHGPEDVRKAYTQLVATARSAHPNARIEGVAVQQFVNAAGEALVAIKRDPHFGPVLVLGTGGLFAEVWRDVAIVSLPATREQIQRAVHSLRGYPLWKGARNRRPADVDALIDFALHAACFADSFPDWLSVLEFNPVVLLDEGSGAVIVDVLTSAE